MIIKTCKMCGKKFEVRDCRKNTAKYCSRKCMSKSKKGKHFSPSTEFEKGHITWIKGIKGLHLSPETEFKKGDKNITGKNHYHWRGGETVDKGGYVLILNRNHPYRSKGNYVREHRLVAEKILGRYLKSYEVVHHINGIKFDNRPENLYLFTITQHKQYESLKNKPILKSNLVKR